MMELTANDLGFAVRRLPTDIRTLLKEFEGRLFVAGGFIRACVANESPSDIDIWGIDKPTLEAAASLLAERRGENTRLHKTKNAITVISLGRITIQFILRWTFTEPQRLVESFDFTVCQAVIWRDRGKYHSAISTAFYVDLSARRLVYTHPVRDEEAGGSLMRALKYVKRGYVIQVGDLAGVISRLCMSIDWERVGSDERWARQVLLGKLHEVDPLLAVDGLDVTDDHETPIEGLDSDHD
jgi:hypothetical protein